MKNSQKELLQIKDSVRRLYDAQKRKKLSEKHYEEVKKKETLMISNFMFSNMPDKNSFEIVLDEGEEYYASPTRLSVARVRTKKIVWFLDKLKQKLNKETYKDIVSKTYTINDIDGLVSYLKQCGVDPKKFKTFIDVTESVDETKLDNYYNTGALSMKAIEGCYEVKLGEPYIRLTELKAIK